MKTNLPLYNPRTEAGKIVGTLGDRAKYQLMRLIEDGNVEAICFVLERPKLMDTKLSDIHMSEANRIMANTKGTMK